MRVKKSVHFIQRYGRYSSTGKLVDDVVARMDVDREAAYQTLINSEE